MFLQETSQESISVAKEETEASKEEKSEKEGVSLDEEEDSLNSKLCDNSSEPTSGKLLDIKTMKVNELRTELEARGLNSKGLKAQLAARLQETIEKEAEMNKNNEEIKETVPDCADAEKLEVFESADKTSNQEETKKKDESKVDVIIEEPEVMEIDRKTKAAEKLAANDDDIFVKPAPALDEKQKQTLAAAYKLPGKATVNDQKKEPHKRKYTQCFH